MIRGMFMSVTIINKQQKLFLVLLYHTINFCMCTIFVVFCKSIIHLSLLKYKCMQIVNTYQFIFKQSIDINLSHKEYTTFFENSTFRIKIVEI